MRVPDLIMKKRDGQELSAEEITYLIEGMVSGEVPDYQMAALCMAIYFRGMTPEETTAMTLAMARSGSTVDLSSIRGVKVDKHSTGGVGDTTTLVLAPMVAAAGAKVAKMSGRGLGTPAAPSTSWSPSASAWTSPREFFGQVNRIGVAVAGATGDIAPADKKLYALRDVTARSSIPLIAASIISKKLATGADAIVLDVKTGSGAFMRPRQRPPAGLAHDRHRPPGRRRMDAVITDMSQPLGMAIGNSLEVIEAIETLQGSAPAGSLKSAWNWARMLVPARSRPTSMTPDTSPGRLELRPGPAEARAMIEPKGRAACTQDPWALPVAPLRATITAPEDGYLSRADALTLGRAAMAMGAGRVRKEDSIDLSCGIVLAKSIGDRVHAGDTLATLYASSQRLLDEGCRMARHAFAVSLEPVDSPVLIHRL